MCEVNVACGWCMKCEGFVALSIYDRKKDILVDHSGGVDVYVA